MAKTIAKNAPTKVDAGLITQTIVKPSKAELERMVKSWHSVAPWGDHSVMYCSYGRPIIKDRAQSYMAKDKRPTVREVDRLVLGPSRTKVQVIAFPIYQWPTGNVWGISIVGTYVELWLPEDSWFEWEEISLDKSVPVSGVGTNNGWRSGSVELTSTFIPETHQRYAGFHGIDYVRKLQELAGLEPDKIKKSSPFSNKDTENLWYLIHANYSHDAHCQYQVELAEELELSFKSYRWERVLPRGLEFIIDHVKELILGYEETYYATVNFDKVNWENLARRLYIQYGSSSSGEKVPTQR